MYDLEGRQRLDVPPHLVKAPDPLVSRDQRKPDVLPDVDQIVSLCRRTKARNGIAAFNCSNTELNEGASNAVRLAQDPATMKMLIQKSGGFSESSLPHTQGAEAFKSIQADRYHPCAQLFEVLRLPQRGIRGSQGSSYL